MIRGTQAIIRSLRMPQRGVAAGFKLTSARWSSSLVSTDLDAVTGIATVTMQHPPVNSLSLEMCQALSDAIKSAESNSGIQALILQSSNPTIFSAGLDLMELHHATRLEDFWRSFQQLYFDLYGSRLACVAAIQGHAPAAGCMLALSCDYRIMADAPKITIGLNESMFGIVAPPWLGQQMVDTIGRRQAELAMALGTLFPPSRALELGLVDQVVAADQVPTAAVEMASKFAKIPPQARVASKLLVRTDRLERVQANRQSDVDNFVNFVTQEETRRNLAAYVASLQRKPKK